MITEIRTYTLYPGKIHDYLKIYQEEGVFDLVREKLGTVMGSYYTEVGELNQFISLVAYDTFEDRLRRRKEFHAHPVFQSYATKVRPMIIRQENKILLNAPFSSKAG